MLSLHEKQMKLKNDNRLCNIKLTLLHSILLVATVLHSRGVLYVTSAFDTQLPRLAIQSIILIQSSILTIVNQSTRLHWTFNSNNMKALID